MRLHKAGRMEVGAVSPPTAADRGRDVRQRLRRAATELIAELGWNAVSTRVLAQRAGVGAGLVHYHYSSLQALLREAAMDAVRQELASATPVLEGAATPATGVDLLLGWLDSYTGSDPASLLFVETYLASTRDPELGAELTAAVASFRHDVARWLDQHGIASPDETAAVLAASVDGLLLHRALHPELTAAVAAPVVRRLVTPTDTRAESAGQQGQEER